ncbi:acyltransferase family protein [Rhodococcus sp. 2G]|uniref:acyltransferase family protein n=2 Tax=Rhodococcus TaxID=1827 RepID=UPI000AC2F0B8|nr:acyltransferase family protein [Rhodococcus sp. 2G]
MSTINKVDAVNGRVSKPSSSFRPDLEGMRAVAVLSVFVNHLFGWPAGGFVGVDIFFVLSGFFITGLLIRERTQSGTISFRNFYIRRVRRIIPASVLVLLVTIVAAYVVFPAQRAKETALDGMWAALFGANWRFQSSGTDYFQEGQPPSPLQHYWSLSIEEQFYFVWPALLLGIFLATRRAARRGDSQRRLLALAGGMGAICLLSFAWSVLESANAPTSAYFSTFTRVWELGVGALIAILGPVITKLPLDGPIRMLLSYVGFAGVVASLFIISEETRFPGPGALLPVLSTALVIAAFHNAPVRGVPFLTNPVSLYFGKTSYSLYLWHWPIIVIFAAILPEGPTYYLTTAVLTLALAHVSFTYFEDPIRRSSWLEKPTVLQRPREISISPEFWRGVGFSSAALVLTAILVIQLIDRENGVGEQYESLYVAGAEEIADVDPCFGAGARVNPNCVPAYEPSDLSPSIDTFAKDNQGAYSCWRTVGGQMKRCTYGSDEEDALRVALIGDSHAAMLSVGLAQQLVSNNWSLTTYLGNGCQWQSWSNGDRDCQSEMGRVQEELTTGEAYDVIITSASREFGGGNKAAAAQAYVDAWEPVAARGTKIFAIADNPTVSEDSLACLTRFGAGAEEISRCGDNRSRALAIEDPLVRATDSSRAELIDLTDIYCDDDWCPTVIGGVIAYRDTAGHISGTFSRTLGPIITERIVERMQG